MNTRLGTALRRGWLAGVTLLAVSMLAAPAQAQTCNAQPQARIAQNQTVPETTGGAPTVVALDGSGSTPTTGATYSWALDSSLPAGTSVTLLNANTPTPTFVAPDVGSAGASLTFKLTVRCTSKSSTATTVVNVTDVVTNAPPTAVADADPDTATEGQTVTLDGSGSYDPDAGTTLDYEWEQLEGPSVTLTDVDPLGAVVSFVAPNTPIETGATLKFLLTVSDGSLAATDTQLVNIVWTNDPPVASLVCPGGLLVVDEGDAVSLDGSASLDPDGSIVLYQWHQSMGLPNIAAVATATGDVLQFTAPNLGYNQVGGTTVVLTVTDDTGASTAAECDLFINDVTAPVIAVPADITEEADSAAGAAVTYSAHAQDAVDDENPYPLACAPASGSVFALAPAPGNDQTTAVACTATDSAGNIATAGFNVTVGDHTGPAITVPGAFGVEATSAAGAVATFGATTTDAVDGAGTATCVPETGSVFPLGDTTVTCDAQDARGNAAPSASFMLTVHDTTAPTIDAHAPVGPIEATGPGGAPVTYAAPATHDLVDGDGTANCLPASGSIFALGTTTVHCRASDAAGNHATTTHFDVTVADGTPPGIDPHADIDGVEATGPDGAAVIYTAPATHDLVDGDGTANCLPASGATFALGTTTVHCRAVDAAGNRAATTQFDVTVVDTTPPTIDAHDAIEDVEATGPGGAAVGYTAPATHDLVDGDGTANCLPASGSTFPLGTTSVHCRAADAAGNHATTTHFDVTVVDRTPPAIEAHDPLGPIEATGAGGAAVSYDSPATHDLVDGDGVAGCLPASGSTFALGISTVTCNASDAAGNAATATTFTIWVVDRTPPTIDAHAPVGPIEATGPGGAPVTYTAPATHDLVDGNGSANCLPASGSTFPLGTTAVHCRAADAAGNHATATQFDVTVVDRTPPTIDAHAPVGPIEATGPAGAVVTYANPATQDLVDGAGTANCLPASGSTFPLGTTAVHCRAADTAGNHAIGTSFTVTVVDTTAPALTGVSGNLDVQATSAAGAVASWPPPTAVDLVDGNRPVTCESLTGLTSGSTFPPGTTTVTCTATDTRGNTASQSFDVTVHFAWAGFFRPIDNLPTVNSVKAGSAVPVKFSLGGNMGSAIFAAGYPRAVQMQCSSGTLEDTIEETVTAGGSSLVYDAATGQYVYVWKTDKLWAGSCRQLQLKLADGTLHVANFKFIR